MTTGRINQVTTNSNDPSRVLPPPASAPRRPRKERGQNRGQSFRTLMNKETDNRLRIPSAFPFRILAHQLPHPHISLPWHALLRHGSLSGVPLERYCLERTCVLVRH